jgi:hypothetical protein
MDLPRRCRALFDSVAMSEDQRPFCIYHAGDYAAYEAATRSEQDAWNEYANWAAEVFNESDLDSYDSTNTYPGRNRDGETTKWCPPIYFPEWLAAYRKRQDG